MKKILPILMLINTYLLSAGLEGFLGTEDKNSLKKEVAVVEYQIVRYKDIMNNMESGASGQINIGRGLSKLQDSENFKDIISGDKKSFSNNIEKIIIKHLIVSNSLIERGIYEKIILSFDIDKRSDISNIKIVKGSTYNEINENFKEAILKAAHKIKIKEDKKNIVVKFDLKLKKRKNINIPMNINRDQY